MLDEIDDKVRQTDAGLLPIADVSISDEKDYAPDVCKDRKELSAFLCQPNINPKEMIIKGKLKSEQFRSKYRGVSKNAGFYQVQLYLNSLKEYFYSF